MLPIIAGVVGVGLLVAAKGRPSTLLRVVEDTAVGAGKGVARRASKFKRGVKVELAARQLAKARRNVEREDKALRAMSKAQRAQHEADVQAVVKRAGELARK